MSSFTPLDAALWYGKNNKAYFFKGNKYVRYNPKTDKVDPGYPKKIKDNWHGIPFNKIDAALWYEKNNKAYFFSGNKYVRYNPSTDKVDPGYPKKIKDNWHGIPFNKIDAALWYGKNNKAYFFSSNQYVRYNPNKDKVDADYPLNTAENWYGLPTKDGIYLKNTHIESIIKNKLKGKLSGSCKFRFGDGRYFCPKLRDAKTIISATHVDQRIWIAERFDCDDFALLLKSEFVKDAYRHGNRRAAHCFGIVWGSLPGPHAINWMINDDMKFRFIEPQNDAVFSPRSTDRNIYFMFT